jgi:hypothetical protein
MVPEGNTARGFEKFIRIGFVVILVVNLVAVILLHFGVFKHVKSKDNDVTSSHEINPETAGDRKQ